VQQFTTLDVADDTDLMRRRHQNWLSWFVLGKTKFFFSHEFLLFAADMYDLWDWQERWSDADLWPLVFAVFREETTFKIKWSDVIKHKAIGE